MLHNYIYIYIVSSSRHKYYNMSCYKASLRLNHYRRLIHMQYSHGFQSIQISIAGYHWKIWTKVDVVYRQHVQWMVNLTFNLPAASCSTASTSVADVHIASWLPQAVCIAWILQPPRRIQVSRQHHVGHRSSGKDSPCHRSRCAGHYYLRFITDVNNII